jgi:anaerobic selenocysteine-containing dehydrogenase
LADQSLVRLPVETKRTYCKVCMTHCGLVADVVGDQIVRIRGDKEHPLTKGYTCPKGRAVGRLHHDEHAITRPMMRKNGTLVEVEWDEALDDIAAKLRRIVDAHGPQAVGINFGSGLGLDASGYAMEEAFYRALGTPPKFSPLTIDSAYELALICSGAVLGGGKVDYDNVELVIYIGINPMVSHGDNNGMWDPATWLRSITKRGGEIWTIDPVRTATANLSTGHLAPYPGKDYAILAWLVRELIDHGPCTPRFPVHGLEEVRAALVGYDRAQAAEIASVTEQDLEDLLDAIRRKGRVAIETGTGIGMSTGANMTAWFSALIVTLTGSDNQVGGMWSHPGFFYPAEQIEARKQARVEGAAAPSMHVRFLPGSNVRPDVKAVIGPGGGPEWPCAVLPLEIEAGNIRAFFNFGGSILRSFPNTNALKTALPKLDLHVDVEIIHNELTPLCTHVLPTKDGVERPEISRWDILRWNVSMEYSAPLVEPMGERRSAWWVISQIMKRSGMPVPDYVLDDDRAAGADDFMLSQLFTPMARCSFDELKEQRYVEFPMPLPAPWVDHRLERIGGYQSSPPDLLEQWHEKRAEDEAALGTPKPLVYSPRRQFKKFNAQLDFMGEPADVILNPKTAAERGIEHGQQVRVHNKNGEIVLTAKVDPTVRQGVCSISHGHADGNVNFLTSTDDVDRLTGMAHYSGVPIEIEPL